MKLFLLCIFGFSFDFVAKCQENHYGLKGKSICLSFSSGNQSHQQTTVAWRRFDRKELLANSKGVTPYYAGRMKLNFSDWSLTIDNLQENDSTLYEALGGNWEIETLAAFALTVENSVSMPVITVSPHDVNSSAGACRAVVNCSVDGSWASYDCDQSLCTKTHASPSSIISITVSVDNRGFQCHVNNHVSKNHSQVPIMCREKQQSDLPSPSAFPSWIAITAGVGVALGIFMGLIVFVVKKRKSSKVHPQSSHAVTGCGITTVIEQHHETIYSTVKKPDASQNPPENNTESNTSTIYDTPTRRPKACQVNSGTAMVENQEQRSGHNRTVQVKATVHPAPEPDSEQINTVYCKLGEI